MSRTNPICLKQRPEHVSKLAQNSKVMARSHCTERDWEQWITILCRTVHTAQGPGPRPDPLSPIAPVRFPVPVPFSVNVP